MTMSLLPQGFAPDVTHVIIGRGKKHSKHPGNLRYSTLIHQEMHAYAAAENKAGKSEVISRLVTYIRNTGNFVREAGQGRWALVEEHAVRTTTAQHFRDALYSKYRSSKEMKKQKRTEDRTVDDDEVPPKKRSRCVSPESSESSDAEEDFQTMPGFFQKHSQAQQDTLSILSSAVFISKIDFQDSNPFEPTPMRDTATSSVFGAYADTLFPSPPMSSGSIMSEFDAVHGMPFFHEVHQAL
jgi:hypothetical protein